MCCCSTVVMARSYICTASSELIYYSSFQISPTSSASSGLSLTSLSDCCGSFGYFPCRFFTPQQNLWMLWPSTAPWLAPFCTRRCYAVFTRVIRPEDAVAAIANHVAIKSPIQVAPQGLTGSQFNSVLQIPLLHRRPTAFSVAIGNASSNPTECTFGLN